MNARYFRRRTVAAWLMLGLPFSTAAAPGQERPDWSDVGVLLAERCVMCHSGEAAPLGLRLDSLAGALAGSQNGRVLVPGDPNASELVRRVRGESEPRMPLAGDPLSPDEVALIERWVSEGLPASASAEQQPTLDEAASPEAEIDVSVALPGLDQPIHYGHVERIFLQRCVQCHSDASSQAPPEGLRLDTYENILKGGERLVVLPGHPAHSELVRRIEGIARPRMPFNGPPWLSEDEIRLVRQWIAQGAADADGNKAPVPVGREVRLRGTLTGPQAIDGAEFAVGADTRIDDRPAVGEQAEMRGIVSEDGFIRATRFRDR